MRENEVYRVYDRNLYLHLELELGKYRCKYGLQRQRQLAACTSMIFEHPLSRCRTIVVFLFLVCGSTYNVKFVEKSFLLLIYGEIPYKLVKIPFLPG